MSRASKRPASGRTYTVEVLEPRLLLSADWLGGLVAPWDPDDSTNTGDLLDGVFHGLEANSALNGHSALPDPLDLNAILGLHSDDGGVVMAAPEAPPRHELVIIDAGVQGYEDLVADFASRAGDGIRYDVHVLQTNADGMAAVTDILSGYSNLDALHIVSHGGDAAIQLGQSQLDASSVESYAELVRGWSLSFGSDADLLVYGCNLASSEAGQALVDSLGSLTGTDVAASTNLTGNALYGGDWNFEYASGTVESAVAFSAQMQTTWSGVLATFVVDTLGDTVDANPGDGFALDASGDVSLRAAIMEANSLPGADVIILPGGTYVLSISGDGEGAAFTGDLDITEDLTITGAGAAQTTIDAGILGDRVFEIFGSTTVEISGVTIANGNAQTNGEAGGAVHIAFGGKVTLDAVVLTGNDAVDGGALYNAGTLTLKNVVVSDNEAPGGFGGGLYNNGGTVTASGSSFYLNSANQGGAVYSGFGGDLTLTNVTVSTNTATQFGAGLYNAAAADITNATFTANSASVSGGGIRVLPSGSLDLSNSIVAGNVAGSGPDVMGAVTSDGSNIILNGSGSSGFAVAELGVDPLLDPMLMDNGGLTWTHALLAGSPAINAVSAVPAPPNDQRGAARDGAPDIGAYEFGASIVPMANDDSYQVGMDMTLIVAAEFGLLANDMDLEFDPLTAYLVSNPANGMLSLNPVGLTGLENLTTDLSDDSSPSWSPDGSQVIFSSSRGGDSNIWLMNADGSGLQQLTFAGSAELKPVWSPDGTQILYQSNAAGTFDIYVMDADGSNPLRLTTGALSDGADEFDANWSPTGARIVYVLDLGLPRIMVMDSDGSNAAPLTDGTTRDTAPVFSPDGTRIAFVSDRSGDEEIHIMDADGGNVMRLTTNTAMDGAPTWSPDGSHILFHAEENGDTHLFVMKADGSGVVQITQGTDANTNAAWSPDGSRIAFQTDRDGNQEIYTSVILSDGGFTYTPDAAFRGFDSFTYQATDGTTISDVATVTLIVGNSAPTATNLSQSIGYLEDAAFVALADIVVTDADAGDTITAQLTLADIAAGLLTASSGNGETYTAATGVWTITGTIAQVNAALAAVEFVPAANSSVNTTISTSIKDLAAEGPPAGVITLTGTAVNDAPSFTTLGDQNVLEDSGPYSVAGFANPLPGGGADEAGQTFSYTVNSDNPGLFSVGPAIDASGTLTYTLNPNVNGTARITVSVTDSGGTADGGVDTSADQTFDIIVAPVNDAPSFTTLGDQNVLEDSGPFTVAGFASPLPGGGADEAGQTFSYTVNSDNPGLFSVGPAIDASGTLTYTLNPNVNGTARVTVSVTDSGGTADGGVDTSGDQTFDIIVAPVNDAPSFTTLGDQNVLEDAGPFTVAGFANPLPGGGADEAGQTFSYTVNSDNPGLFSVGPAIDASGTLTYTLNPNANGTARITVSVTDSGGTADGGVDSSGDQTFDIIVAPVNDAPSFTTLGDQNVLEDSGPFTVAGFANPLPGGGSDESGQTFSYTVNSDNPGLFSVGPAIDASGTLTYTLNPNVNGTARITVSVTDSGGTADGGVDTSADQTFDIIVAPVNDAPSFTTLGDQNVLEDAGPFTVAGFASPLPGGGADEAGQTFTYTVNSDNPGLFSVGPAIDASGTLTYTLNPNVNGTARITVSVTDSGGTADGGVDTSGDQTFDIIVAPVNDAPSFTTLGDQNVLEDTGPFTVAGFANPLPGGGADEAGQTFSYTVNSDNPGLFSVGPAIDVSGTLTYTLNPNVNGTARVTVSVTDSGGTADGGVDSSGDQTFDIIVAPVNDAPSFTTLGDQNVLEDAGPFTVAGFASPLPGGGADEAGQTFSYTVNSDNPGLFSVGPAIDASGTLTYTLNPNVNGTARITVSVTDSGGTADGGVDTSADQTFDIIVAPVNDAPSANSGGPYAIDEGGQLDLDASASVDQELDPLTFQWDLSYDGVTFNVEASGAMPSLDWMALQAIGLDDDGTFTVAVRADDGNGGTDIHQTTLTIANVAPTISVTGSGAASVGGSYTLTLTDTDPGDDTILSWTINWGDGTVQTFAGDPSSVTHTYTGGGFTYNILASATDEDGTVLQNELLVASYAAGDSIFRFEETTGNFLQQFATANGLDDPIEVIIGPDGNLYVTGEASDTVLRYNAVTGAFIDVFVAFQDGGLSSPGGLAFGPDGNLYVASYDTDEVLRFDGTSGAFIDAFVSAGSGGLDQAFGLTFGPDGNLYVNSFNQDEVLRYDGSTGAFINAFVSSGSGGLSNPEQMIFGPDGNLYIASIGTDNVLRYDGATGAFIDTFVPAGRGGLDEPAGLAFGPDGNLYVSDFQDAVILRYDGVTGAFIDEYVSPGSGGLVSPAFIQFLPGHQVTVSASNTAPTLTIFNTPVDTTNEDTMLEVSYADLILAGDENDADGTVDAFVIRSVTSGTLLIGSSAGTATPWAAGSNDIVDGSNSAFWMPAADTTGTQNAFEVVARDDGGLESAANVAVQIAVNPVNDAPLLGPLEDQNVLEDSGPYSVAGFASAVQGGGSDESGQTFSYTVSSDNPGLFSVGPAIDASGTLTYTLNPNVNGAARVTVSVTDSGGTANGGVDTSADQTFDIIVAPVNDAPSVIALRNQNVLEDSGPYSVAGFASALPGGGADESGQTFSYTVSSDNPGLFSVGPAIDASGTLTYTLNPNVNGAARVTVSVTDSGGTANGGVDTSADQTFDIIVAPVNDAPSVIALRNQNVLEDSGPYSVAGFASALPGGGADESGQTFSYTVSSDNPGLFSVGPAIDASGTLTYTLNPNVNGTARVTVSVTDSGGTANGGVDTSADQTFDIIVVPVNDAPSFTTLGDQNVLEDSGPYSVAGFASALPGGGADESGQTFSYTVNSDNPGLFLVGPAIDASGTLTYTLNPNVNGAARVIVSVTDSGGTANGGVDTSADQTFDIIVAPVNDAPSVIALRNQNVLEDSGPYSVAGFASALPGGGADESGQTFSYTVSSDNPGLFSVGPTIDASGTLTYTLNPNVNGTARVTVSVTDSGGTANGGVDTSADQTFDIIVVPVNDAPSFTTLGDQNVLEDSGPYSVSGFANPLPGGGADEAGQTFSYTVSSDNPGLFSVGPAIDASGTLTYTLNPNVNGTARVTVSVTDSGGTANGGVDTSAGQTFDIIVAPVDSTPTATNLDQALLYLEDSGPVALHDILVNIGGSSGIVSATLTLGDIATGRLTANSGNGEIYSAQTGVWTITGSVSRVNAALAAVAFVPTPDNDVSTAITASVRNAAGVGPVDGQITLGVVPVNDAPSGQDNLVAVLGNAAYAFTAADFGFSDAVEGNSLLGVRIVSMPAGFSALLNNGEPVSAGDVINIDDIVAGRLQLVTPTGSNTDSTVSLIFQVQDDGGTAAGGVDLDPVERQLTILVYGDRIADESATPPLDNSDNSAANNDLASVTPTTPAWAWLPLEIPQTEFLPSEGAQIAPRPVVIDVPQHTGWPLFQSVATSGSAETLRVVTAGAQVPDFESIVPVDTKRPGNASLDTVATALDEIRNAIDQDLGQSQMTLGKATVGVLGLSVGYVSWLLRGGILLSSVLSSMPVWRFVDPLPVFMRGRNKADDDDDESLESIVQSSSTGAVDQTSAKPHDTKAPG